MSNIDKIVGNRIVQNVLIWFFLVLLLIGSVQGTDKLNAVLIILAVIMPPIYVNNLFILPKLKKNKLQFTLLFLLNVFVFTTITAIIIMKVSKESFSTKMFTLYPLVALSVLFGMAIKLARDSFVIKQKEKEAKLQLLKGQLNPHFLFNTLNNLYGLSVVKSDKLPELMLKLSDLLRYSIYDTNDSLVSLEKEISYLENYISLERIRLEETTSITFNKPSFIGDKKIAPMLLIVFVENAFKHLDNSNGNSNVNIDISIDGDTLHFKCSNNYDKSTLKTNLELKNSGIGMVNVKKRLELMYPNIYDLSINKDHNEYLVNLTLQLT